MDWLFGRKKSETKVEEGKDMTPIVDDFVFPPMPDQRFPGYPSLQNYNPPIPAAPASNIPPHPMYSLPTTSHQFTPPQQTNPLDSIPFRLSSRLESGTATRIPTDVQRIGSFLSDLQRSLNSSELNYDFGLERSVLRETSVFNGL